jgi:hypothetical protein
MVYKDRSARCTGYQKYGEGLDEATARLLKKKAKRLGRNLRCEGPLDHRVTGYIDRLIAEDKAPHSLRKPTEKKRARH